MIADEDTRYPEDWRERALCAQTGQDDELWFPPQGGGDYRQAKAMCAKCPVRNECLTDARRNGEQWGVWGGLSVEERKALPPLVVEEGAPGHGNKGGTVAGYQREIRAGVTPCAACRTAASAARLRDKRTAQAKSETVRAAYVGNLTGRRI